MIQWTPAGRDVPLHPPVVRLHRHRRHHLAVVDHRERGDGAGHPGQHPVVGAAAAAQPPARRGSTASAGTTQQVGVEHGGDPQPGTGRLPAARTGPAPGYRRTRPSRGRCRAAARAGARCARPGAHRTSPGSSASGTKAATTPRASGASAAAIAVSRRRRSAAGTLRRAASSAARMAGLVGATPDGLKSDTTFLTVRLLNITLCDSIEVGRQPHAPGEERTVTLRARLTVTFLGVVLGPGAARRRVRRYHADRTRARPGRRPARRRAPAPSGPSSPPAATGCSRPRRPRPCSPPRAARPGRRRGGLDQHRRGRRDRRRHRRRRSARARGRGPTAPARRPAAADAAAVRGPRRTPRPGRRAARLRAGHRAGRRRAAAGRSPRPAASRSRRTRRARAPGPARTRRRPAAGTSCSAPTPAPLTGLYGLLGLVVAASPRCSRWPPPGGWPGPPPGR